MAQNIYDDEAFFDGYAQLPRSIEGLDGAPEWPAVRAMLPDLGGARIVDLGCGYGWFSRWAVEHGAASVLGIDLSERMLDRARSDTPSAVPIEYRRADLETVTLEPDSYDVAHSSMALHYVEDLSRLIGEIATGLVTGGTLVCSVEHPIRTAPTRPRFLTDADGSRSWSLDHYLRQGPRSSDWIAPGVVKQHRTTAGYITLLLEHGFRLDALEEWCPSDHQLDAHPDWADELHRPTYLLLRAGR